MKNFRYRKLTGSEIVEPGDWVTQTDWDLNNNDDMVMVKRYGIDSADGHGLPRIDIAMDLVGRRADEHHRYNIWRIEVIGLLVASSEPVSTERKIDLQL